MDISRELATSAQLSRAQRRIILIISWVVVILSALSLYQAVSAREQSAANQKLISVVEDCINPTGKCYKQSRSNNNSSVSLINRYTEAAAVCAHLTPEPATEAGLKACIEKKVKNGN